MPGKAPLKKATSSVPEKAGLAKATNLVPGTGLGTSQAGIPKRAVLLHVLKKKKLAWARQMTRRNSFCQQLCEFCFGQQ